MSEIDLVPARYRRRRRMRVWLIRAVTAYFIVVIEMLGVRSFLGMKVSAYEAEIENLEFESARAELEQRELTMLGGQRESLAQRLGVLKGLRGGIAAKQMFQVVDASLDPNIRFRRWTFRRAGEIVSSERKAVETGYFIVIPRESPDEPQRRWQFHTHMEITAEAEDHSSLAGFVRRLSQRPEIESVRILNTVARKEVASEHVEFELAIVVRSSQ